MAEQQMRELVRIVDTNIKGDKKLPFALTYIKGVGSSYAHAVCTVCNTQLNKKIGELSQQEIENLEDAIRNPKKYGIPTWLLNRRKDIESGEDTHVVSSTVKFTTEVDIKRLKKMKCYRGMRHAFGLPVRGQRTKSNFREGSALGVQRKKNVKAGRV